MPIRTFGTNLNMSDKRSNAIIRMIWIIYTCTKICLKMQRVTDISYKTVNKKSGMVQNGNLVYRYRISDSRILNHKMIVQE